MDYRGKINIIDDEMAFEKTNKLWESILIYPLSSILKILDAIPEITPPFEIIDANGENLTSATLFVYTMRWQPGKFPGLKM